jgi:hypothetical protein
MGISYPLFSVTVGAFPFSPAGKLNDDTDLLNFKLRLLIHSDTSVLFAPPEKRLPEIQCAEGASARKFVSLEPIPLLWEVQNGIIVLPEKSWLSRNVYMIFGACPHQMG